MEVETIGRIFQWHDFWPITLLLLAMAGAAWLVRKGEEEEDRMRADGRFNNRDEEGDKDDSTDRQERESS